MAKDEKGITVKKNEDFSEWFTQLIQKADLADIRYGVQGFPVYNYWATKAMKKMYKMIETILEKKGHEPVMFPAVIPEKNFKLERQHAEGFKEEVFWLETPKGEEKLALRPTSETAFYQMYSLWIRSYQDLPFKRYQSCQVWRSEVKNTRPFFRGREFYWIETHCAFATEADAMKQVKEDMETTKEFLEEQLAVPFIFFKRTQWDKFSGAVNTFAADALMPSGKVLQLPSTHMLGQNFSKPFDVKFKDKDGKEKYVYITCYGPAVSRIFGAVIALHGDDKGLVLPWNVAPIEIVIVPIWFEKEKDKVDKKCKEIFKKLSDYAVKFDDREDYSAGWKFNEWELKGIPIRIEVGPKDVKSKSVTIFRRDTNKKIQVKEGQLTKEIEKIKKEFTKNLLKNAKNNLNIKEAKSLNDIEKHVKDNIVKIEICSVEKDGVPCAEKIEKQTAATIRGEIFGEKNKAKGKCVICNRKANNIVYVARSY